jgi:hypothetical protein
VGPRQSTVDTDTDLRFVGISYIQGLFYKLKIFLGKFGCNVVGKPSNTLFGSIFSKLKYKTPTPLKSTVVYKINCRDCALCYFILETPCNIERPESGNTKRQLILQTQMTAL